MSEIWHGHLERKLPGAAGNSGLPGAPGAPEQPNRPELPEKPETPDKPELPEAPEKPNKPDTPGANVSFAKRVVELVNIERAKEGLTPLAIDEKMESAALVRAKEIQSSFSHTRPNGSSFSTALKEAGVNYMRSGENIAWGQRSPEEVVRGWMNRPSHRANIMNGSFSRIGVGHLQNSAGTSYWVQLFAN